MSRQVSDCCHRLVDTTVVKIVGRLVIMSHS